jgi:hypothetical protein
LSLDAIFATSVRATKRRLDRYPAVLLVRWTQKSRIPAAKKRSVADNFLQKQQKQRALWIKGPVGPALGKLDPTT